MESGSPPQRREQNSLLALFKVVQESGWMTAWVPLEKARSGLKTQVRALEPEQQRRREPHPGGLGPVEEIPGLPTPLHGSQASCGPQREATVPA